MLKLTILLMLIVIPMICRSQDSAKRPENFLGKKRKEIKDYFKSNRYKYSETFDDSDKEQLLFIYDKNKKCIEVIKTLKLSKIDSVKDVLNRTFDKKEGETFSDVWADKAKTFKIHPDKFINWLFLEYLPYNQPYRIN